MAIINIGAIISAIVSASSPALSILLAWVFLKERINKRQTIGVILVILGTILTTI